MSSPALYDKIVLTSANKTERLIPKVYRGFSTISTDSENFNLYDLQLIQQDLLNYFNTRQGERVMNPEFGCVIWDYIFEPLTPEVQNIITENVNAIINYDPRINATQVMVTSYESGIQIECVLSYVLYNVSQVMKLRFDQANGLLS